MSNQGIPAVYSTQDGRLLNISEPPFLSSIHSSGNMTLGTFDLPAAEMPEYRSDQHGISVNIGQGFQLEQVIEGKLQKGFIPPGGSCFCPSYNRQAYRWDRQNQIILLNLNPELLHLHTDDLLKTDRVELIPHFAIQDQLICQIGLALQAELRSAQSAAPTKPADNGMRLYVETMTNALAVHLLRRYSTQADRTINSNGGLPQHKLMLVTDYISDQLDRELSLAELAAIAQLSQYHFCRAFKQTTGLTPYQYLIQQRVERAKELLKTGKIAISEIAITCGFTHQSHLHRHFKRLTGVTPKTWQNS